MFRTAVDIKVKQIIIIFFFRFSLTMSGIIPSVARCFQSSTHVTERKSATYKKGIRYTLYTLKGPVGRSKATRPSLMSISN